MIRQKWFDNNNFEKFSGSRLNSLIVKPVSVKQMIVAPTPVTSLSPKKSL